MGILISSFPSWLSACKKHKKPPKKQQQPQQQQKQNKTDPYLDLGWLGENNIKNESSIKNPFILSQMHFYFRLFSTSPNPSNNLEVFPEVLPIFGHLWKTKLGPSRIRVPVSSLLG